MDGALAPIGTPVVLWATSGPGEVFESLQDVPLIPGERRRYRLVETTAQGDSVRDEAVVSRPLPPATARVLSAGPSPFLPGGAPFRLRLSPSRLAEVDVFFFDGGGRRVASRTARATAMDEIVVEWDGRGNDGARLPSGVYFYRFRQGVAPRGGRLILLH